MVLACRPGDIFKFFVFSFSEATFADRCSLFAPFLKPKSIQNQAEIKKVGRKKPIALGRRLDSVLRSILEAKVEKRRLPGVGLTECAGRGEDPWRGTRTRFKSSGKSSGLSKTEGKN